MVAFLPAPASRSWRSGCKCQVGPTPSKNERDQVWPERHDVAPDPKPILDVRVGDVAFGIDPQIVLAGRHARNENAGARATPRSTIRPRPRPNTGSPRARRSGLSRFRVLIEREIEVRPRVVDAGIDVELDRARLAQRKRLGDERGLGGRAAAGRRSRARTPASRAAVSARPPAAGAAAPAPAPRRFACSRRSRRHRATAGARTRQPASGGAPGSANAFQICSPVVYSPSDQVASLVRALPRQHERRRDEIRDFDPVIDARRATGTRPARTRSTASRGLEVPERPVGILGRRPLRAGHRRQGMNRPDVAPMALILAEIAKPLIRIEQHVLVPAVGGRPRPRLIAAGSRSPPTGGRSATPRLPSGIFGTIDFSLASFLQDGERRIARVENRAARRARDRRACAAARAARRRRRSSCS